jgi:hypothetical protein
MLFGEDRSQMRQVFFQAWEKFHKGEELEGVEPLVIDVLHRHPEYHEVVGRPDAHADKDYHPEAGQENPFLHMGMHMALAEQVGMDRPEGIRTVYEQLGAGLGDTHAVEHAMMECLGQALWQAQRNGQSEPDEAEYMDCLRQLARDKGGRTE